MRLALAIALLPGVAFADDICTDRPSKSTSPCATPYGQWQVEANLADDADGILSALDVTLKYGLSKNIDIEAELPVYTAARGFSGGWLRGKAVADAVGPWQYGAILSARVSGPMEAAFTVPIQYTLSPAWSANFDPEVDLVSGPRGYALAFVNVFSVNWTVRKIVLTSEAWDLDSRYGRQTSADAAIEWIIRPDLEVDAGLNAGLTRDTPRMEFYVGFGRRF
jgi:hypothetical protein